MVAGVFIKCWPAKAAVKDLDEIESKPWTCESGLEGKVGGHAQLMDQPRANNPCHNATHMCTLTHTHTMNVTIILTNFYQSIVIHNLQDINE